MNKMKKTIMSVVTTSLVVCMTITAFAYSISDSYISTKWNAKGGSSGVLGSPTTNTLDNYFRTGKYNRFEGGIIHHEDGAKEAYEVHGEILNLWSWLGWETSPLGFPQSDEYTPGSSSYSINDKASKFDNGIIYWSTKKWGNYITSQYAWPVMTCQMFGPSTPNGTQKINSVSIWLIDGIEFPYHAYTINGKGFPANKKVTAYVSSIDDCHVLGDVIADSTGNFTLYGYEEYLQGVPAYKGVVTVWVKSEAGPAAIYSYRPSNVNLINYTELR